jgi:hypothetical protein
MLSPFSQLNGRRTPMNKWTKTTMDVPEPLGSIHPRRAVKEVGTGVGLQFRNVGHPNLLSITRCSFRNDRFWSEARPHKGFRRSPDRSRDTLRTASFLQMGLPLDTPFRTAQIFLTNDGRVIEAGKIEGQHMHRKPDGQG